MSIPIKVMLLRFSHNLSSVCALSAKLKSNTISIEEFKSTSANLLTKMDQELSQTDTMSIMTTKGFAEGTNILIAVCGVGLQLQKTSGFISKLEEHQQISLLQTELSALIVSASNVERMTR